MEKGEPSSKAKPAEKAADRRKTNEDDAAETEVKTQVAPEVGATKTSDAPGRSKFNLVAEGALPFVADKKKSQSRPRMPKVREDDSVSLMVESEEERDLIHPEENQDDMADRMANIDLGTQEQEKARKKSPDKEKDETNGKRRRDDDDQKRRDDNDRKRRDAEDRKRWDDDDRRHHKAEDRKRKEDDDKKRQDNEERK